jgi:hypothetical protein
MDLVQTAMANSEKYCHIFNAYKENVSFFLMVFSFMECELWKLLLWSSANSWTKDDDEEHDEHCI